MNKLTKHEQRRVMNMIDDIVDSLDEISESLNKKDSVTVASSNNYGPKIFGKPLEDNLTFRIGEKTGQMNIIEATEEAIKQGRGITRLAWGPNPPIILPTNTSLCFVSETSHNQLMPRWEPKAEDVLAEDWKVYG